MEGKNYLNQHYQTLVVKGVWYFSTRCSLTAYTGAVQIPPASGIAAAPAICTRVTSQCIYARENLQFNEIPYQCCRHTHSVISFNIILMHFRSWVYGLCWFFWWLSYAHQDNITSRQQPQGQCEEDFLIMSSNRKPHGDSGINAFSTGAESRQDAVTGKERGRGKSW